MTEEMGGSWCRWQRMLSAKMHNPKTTDLTKDEPPPPVGVGIFSSGPHVGGNEKKDTGVGAT